MLIDYVFIDCEYVVDYGDVDKLVLFCVFCMVDCREYVKCQYYFWYDVVDVWVNFGWVCSIRFSDFYDVVYGLCDDIKCWLFDIR